MKHSRDCLLRALAIAMIAVFMLLAPAGCSPAGAAPTATAQSAATTAPATAKPVAEASASAAQATAEPAAQAAYPIVTDGSVTLSYWVELNTNASQFISSYAENTALQKMQELTGINIEWIHPASGQVQEQFNLLMVSGDLPDIVGAPSLYKGGVFQMMYDGFSVDLSDKVDQSMPDYAALMREDPEFYREITDDDGKIPAVFCYKPAGDPAAQRLLIREDILEQIGVGIPETIADYENMFEKMLQAGITPYMLLKNGSEPQFSSPYGALPDFYKDLDGQILYGFVEPGYKDYLTMMSNWYAKGYISKDFASIDGKQTETLFDTGKIGMYAAACVAAYNRGLRSGFTLTTTPYPRLEKGQQLHHFSQDIWPMQSINSTMAAISSQCDHVEEAMRWFDFGFTDEGIELLNYGIEGETWDWQGDVRVYHDDITHNETMGTEALSYIVKLHFFPKYMMHATECHINLLADPASLALRFKWSDDPNVDSAFILPPFQPTEDESTRIASLMTNIDTYVSESVLKFITGAESLDNFDKYVETIKGMGLNEVLQIKQAAYDRYMAKSAN